MDEKQNASQPLGSLTCLSIIGQVVLLPVAAISSFSDIMLKLMFIAIVAYWALAVAIWSRREKGLSKDDIFLLKWGFYLVFVVTYGLGPVVAVLIGGR